MRQGVNINGHGNIVGNHNTVQVNSAWAEMRLKAQAHIEQLSEAAGRLERWAFGIFMSGLALLGLLGDWLPAKAGVVAFGVTALVSVIAIKSAELNRKEAQRLREYYGLF